MLPDSQNSATEPQAAEASRRRSRWGGILLIALLALAVGATAWGLRARGRAAQAQAEAAASAAAARVIPVLTAKVTQRDVPVFLEGLGTVAAFYTVTVKPQIDGRIVRVAFREGQVVRKGDLLIQIDPRPFAVQLESAQAALARDVAQRANARLNLDRYRSLRDQKLIPDQQLTDQAATVAQLDGQVQGDRAQVDAARLNLDYAQIRSPIDGVTGVRLVDPGNVVHPADPGGLVVLTQIDPIAVFFTLPQDDLGSVATAMAAGPLTVAAFSRDGAAPLAEGKLTVIDNEINQATSTIRLKAIFDNPQRLLWPNQFVKARLRVTTRAGAIVVPAAVVQRGPQGTFAYVVGRDVTAELRPVTVEEIQGELAIIGGGLTLGEQVVLEGQAQLRPGIRVAPRPATAPGPRSARAETDP